MANVRALSLFAIVVNGFLHHTIEGYRRTSTTLLKKSQYSRFKSPRKLNMPVQEEIADSANVLFLVQRSGLSDTDLTILKNFIKESGRTSNNVGLGKRNSRFAVTMFTALTYHVVTYEDCCGGGLGQLDYLINYKMIFMDEEPSRFYDKENHTDLSKNSVDLEYGLHAVREKNLVDELLPQYKPTVLFLLLNFQTEAMSFNVLNNAIRELKGLKALGVHIVTIIIDPLKNRQPQIKEDFPENTFEELREADLSPNVEQDKYKIIIDYVHARELQLDENDYRQGEILEKYKGKNDPVLGGIAKLNEPRIQPKLLYKNLVLQYARALSSIPEHGFKLDGYENLWSRNVMIQLMEIVRIPMKWFGAGEIEINCWNTRNLYQRMIWSANYFTHGKYPNGKECKWTITASSGYYVSLTFQNFHTEETFDRVTIYDGVDEKTSPPLATLSGSLTSEEKNITVNSTMEKMLVHFQPDGGNNEKGFLARWNPFIKFEIIENVSIVFLVDVSGSILEEDLLPVSEWIQTTTQFFLIDDAEVKENDISDDEERSERELIEEEKPSFGHAGMVSFAYNSQIVKDIKLDTTREKLVNHVMNLNLTEEPTHLGKALDYTRVEQFLSLIEETAVTSNFSENSTEEEPKMPRRVVFIFSDWHSVDNPKGAITRLCEWKIIPVFIGIGLVNLQMRQDLVTDCGLAFYVETPIPEVISSLRKIWGIFKIATTPAPVSTTSTTLPPKPSTTTIITTTTPHAGSETLTTTRTYPYTGTYPTLPPSTPLPFAVDEFNYSGVVGLLATLAVVQTIGLCSLVSYTSSLEVPLIPSESSESMANERKRKEKEEYEKLPKSAKKELAKLPKPPEDNKTRRPTRYPQAVNSFFTRSAVPPWL